MTAKSHTLAIVSGALSITALATGHAVARSGAADHPRYAFVDLGTLGGPQSFVTPLTGAMNRRGTAAPCADTAAANPNAANSSPAYGASLFTSHVAFSANGRL